MPTSKKQTKKISGQQKKLARLIHRWAYMDAQKKPKTFNKLFEKIWDSRPGKERQ